GGDAIALFVGELELNRPVAHLAGGAVADVADLAVGLVVPRERRAHLGGEADGAVGHRLAELAGCGPGLVLQLGWVAPAPARAPTAEIREHAVERVLAVVDERAVVRAELDARRRALHRDRYPGGEVDHIEVVVVVRRELACADELRDLRL